MSLRATDIDVQRRIAADPTSAVLLLASPAAAELWPGVRLEAVEPGEQIHVRVTLPPEAAAVAGLPEPIVAVVRAEPPQRTPTQFVVRFAFDAAEVPATNGTLTLTYAPVDDREKSATVARVVFSVAPGYVSDSFLRFLERSARTFLDNLASVAEKRSHAA